MTWNVKYRIEFKDIAGIDFKHDIEEDDFDGSITDLVSTGEPAIFEFDSNSDDIVDPIHERSISLNVYSLTNFALIDLYSVDDQHYRIKCYENGVLKYTGYLTTKDYTEPYEDTPYMVTIKATCGLNMLSSILYDDAGTYYTGRQLESKIILDILAKIGFTSFTEYINIYESSMDATVDDSPLDQLKIDVDVFKDMYCNEVLTELLKKWGACIIQKDGNFVIDRPIDRINTMYGRIFTGVQTKTSCTLTGVKYINRSTHPSTLRQVPGGALMITRPAKKVIFHQDYGYKQSWIDNWEIKGETWDTSTWESWANAGGIPIKSFLLEEKNGVALHASSTLPSAEKLVQNFGSYAKTSTDKIGIKFDYQVYNAYADGLAGFINIRIKTSGHYLKWAAGDELCTWTDGANYITITFGPTVMGGNGWNTFESSVVGIPDAGPIEISLYGPYRPDAIAGIWTMFQNIKFFSTADTPIYTKVKRKLKYRIAEGFIGRMVMSGGFQGSGGSYSALANKYYYTTSIKDNPEVIENTITGTNAINGVELSYDLLLGDVVHTSTPADAGDTSIDNILEQFAGSLASSLLETLAQAAANFVTDHAGDYVTGGVVVTQGTGANTHKILFSAATAGVDTFTGSTTITNTAGDLTGSVDVHANVTAVARVDNVYPTAGAVDYRVVCDGVSLAMFWNTNLATTIQTFVDTYGGDFTNLNVTHYATYIKFEAKTAGVNFSGSTSITNLDTGDSAGDIVYSVANRVAEKRVDTVTLSSVTGDIGTANILCDAVTKDVVLNETIDFTTIWNSRGKTEAKSLLKIINAEITLQNSRPKQLIQMSISETGSGVSTIDVQGNYQDDLSQISSVNRKYIFNRGTFDSKFRKWMIDLIEIIE
jgi:hypothetical protein